MALPDLFVKNNTTPASRFNLGPSFSNTNQPLVKFDEPKNQPLFIKADVASRNNITKSSFRTVSDKINSIKNFGIGLAKGVGTLATTPGMVADLIIPGGIESDLTPEQVSASKTMLEPQGTAQKTGHTIGSLSPGSEFVQPQLEKRGVNPKLAFGIGLGIDVLTPGPGEDARAPEIFRGLKDITTNVLERLKGKSTVSKQFISDLTNMPELKQAERNLIRDALQGEGDVVNAKNFANKVKTELLPLKRTDNLGNQYENISLPEDLRGPIADYGEHIYNSPIKTSAAETHFGNRSQGSAQGYFAHTRIEDLPTKNAIKDRFGNEEILPGDVRSAGLKGDTRRVIELQSDLFQKGRLEGHGGGYDYELRNAQASGDPERIKRWEGHVAQRDAEKAKLEPYRNTWHERVIREEVKQAAKDGKKLLQFPTGETAMKIEGLGENSQWYTHGNNTSIRGGVGLLTPENVKVGKEISQRGADALGGEKWIITDVLGDGKFKAVPKVNYEYAMEAKNNPGNIHKISDLSREGVDNYLSGLKETFDISGKVDTNNPIYKFYEKEVGRYLKNKYNAELVTDPQGVKWWQINVKPEQGKTPIEAFAGIPLGIGLTTPLGSRKIEVNMEDKPQHSPYELNRVGGTVFGELSNTGGEQEARDILSTIVNRTEGKRSLQDVVTEPHQYQAYRGNQYTNYIKGNLDYPSEQKAKLVRKIITELEQGTFKPTTTAKFFTHKNGKLILSTEYNPN